MTDDHNDPKVAHRHIDPIVAIVIDQSESADRTEATTGVAIRAAKRAVGSDGVLVVGHTATEAWARREAVRWIASDGTPLGGLERAVLAADGAPLLYCSGNTAVVAPTIDRQVARLGPGVVTVSGAEWSVDGEPVAPPTRFGWVPRPGTLIDTAAIAAGTERVGLVAALRAATRSERANLRTDTVTVARIGDTSAAARLRDDAWTAAAIVRSVRSSLGHGPSGRRSEVTAAVTDAARALRGLAVLAAIILASVAILASAAVGQAASWALPTVGLTVVATVALALLERRRPGGDVSELVRSIDVSTSAIATIVPRRRRHRSRPVRSGGLSLLARPVTTAATIALEGAITYTAVRLATADRAQPAGSWGTVAALVAGVALLIPMLVSLGVVVRVRPRRASSRVELEFNAAVDGRPCRVVDVSIGGLAVAASSPIDVSDRVDVLLDPDHGALAMTVVRCFSHGRRHIVGLQLAPDAPAAARTALERTWLDATERTVAAPAVNHARAEGPSPVGTRSIGRARWRLGGSVAVRVTTAVTLVAFGAAVLPPYPASFASGQAVVLKAVQSGTVTLPDGSTSVTATITPVATGKAFLTYGYRGSDNDPSDIVVSGVLTNSTTLTFARYGNNGPVVIEWSVVEFLSGVAVQRGVASVTTADVNVPIATVDTTRTFPMVGPRTSGAAFGGDDFFRAEITSPTNLRISTISGGTNTVPWQVVTYDEASVQTGTVSFTTADASRTAAIAPVDTAKSWLTYSLTSSDLSGDQIGQALVRGQVTNPTTLTFDRSVTGTTITLRWYLVEFQDSTIVQHGNAAFGSATSTVDVALATPVEVGRSISTGGYLTFGGRSPYTSTEDPGVGWFTTDLTSPTSLRIQRGAPVATADLGWFVVTWPTNPVVVVNSTGDAADTTPGDGVCWTGSNNSAGAPECTLRAAIQEANASAIVDAIHFAIPSAGPTWTIAPTSGLPTITAPVTVDATTQTGWASTPVVVVDGVSAGGASGLVATGSDVTIRGVAVGRFATGVIGDGTGFVLEDSHVGTNAAGTAPFPNGFNGVSLTRPDGTIQRNLISGNTADGIIIDGGSRARLVDNRIGTTVDGNGDLGNGEEGIEINSSDDVVIGEPGNGNVISGNGYAGVNGWTGSPTGVVIQSNLIGVGADGTTPLPNGTLNGEGGIVLRTSASDWLIGGTAPGEGNVIAHNDTDGIQFENIYGNADDIAILGNAIDVNLGLGIDIGRDGVTPNDTGDVDTGPNDLLNFPEISSATVSGATVDVSYSLDVPAGDYRVEFFANPAGADPTGYGEGEVFVHAEAISHTGLGAVGFTASLPATVGYITATVTEDLGAGSFGSTSEFSAAVCVDSDADGLCFEDWNRDGDADPATDPGPDTDGEGIPNYLDPDDDGDGIPTADENADPNSDGEPRDAVDTDRDGQPDYLDIEAGPSSLPIADEQKISSTSGGLVGPLDDADSLGQDLTGIGDLDGDGIDDLAVGVPEDDDGGTNRGAVYVLFMNADGTVRAEQKVSDTAGGFTGVLDDFDEFGHGVATIGDVDGDGITDIAVGTWNDGDGGPGRGAVWVLFLERDGTVKAHQKISDTTGGLVATLDDFDRFGSSLTGVGDLDGDGTPDLAVGARWDDDGGTDRGATYIVFLNRDGSVRGEQKISDTAGGLTGILDDLDEFGHDVDGIGDLDGDGIGDVAVGAPLDDDGGTDRGAVHVLFMNADGTVRDEQKLSATAGSLTAALDDGDWFGSALAGIGDLDGNGTPDLAVGARGDTDGAWNAGAVHLLRLAVDGTVVGADKISATTGGLTGPLDVFDHFGRGISSLGDLDGDGRLNLAVSARYDDDGGTDRGAVYILDLSEFNNAPVLDDTGTMTFTSIGEDDFTNTGNTVAEIIASAGGDRITDADGDPEGIIWTGHTEGTHNGWFEYSLDGGTTWTRYGWYRNGLLLRDTDRIRFVPAGFGAETASITFRAWDQTVGSAGDALRTYATGGTAAFSAATETATITATAVNDTPVFGIPAQIGPGGSSDTVITVDLENRGEHFYAVAETGDGRIVAAGSIDGDVLLARFGADGSVDASFGDNGYVIQPIGTGTDAAYELAVQADGRIVIAGRTNSGTNDGLVARFDVDGNLDPTFGGGDGWTSIPSVTPSGLAIQPDGNIVIAGASGLTLFAARFDTVGALDASFGSGGTVVHAAIRYAVDLALQTDGKLLVATDTGDAVSVARLTSTGAIDTTFGGGDGVASTTLGLTDPSLWASGVAVQADGSIVATGSAWEFAPSAWQDELAYVALARFTSSGLLDPTFGGGDGYVLDMVPGGGYWGGMESVAIQSDGDIVTAGYFDLGYKGQNDTVVARHLADGTLDTTFDDDGFALTATSRYWNYLYDVLIAADGDIVAVGDASADGLVIRYDASGATVATPATHQLDGAPTYVSGGPAVIMDGDVAVYDRELLDLSSWAGTSLTVTRQGTADGSDEFVATGNLGALTEGGPLVLSGTTIGTIIANSAGTLRLDFTGSANRSRVGQTLESLAYRNLTADPGVYTMAWTFDDGAGAVANGTIDVTIETFTAVVNSTGDAPDSAAADGICDTGGNNSEGDPECTLRAAIDEANALGGGSIDFDIPTSDANHSAGTWTITPAAGNRLPTIEAPVTIDGATQPGATVNSAQTPNPMNGRLAIQLSGTSDSVTDDWDGLVLGAGSSGSEIRGLSFTGWDNEASDAILAWGSSDNVIAGNYFGVRADGTAAGDGVNAGVGIAGGGAGNRIGGTDPADRNLFSNDTASGNAWTAVWVAGSTTTATVVQGNEIGFGIGGVLSPGGYAGVHVFDGATAVVGGVDPRAANRITGRMSGVVVQDSTTASLLGNHIWGNSGIGVDLDGDGVTVNDAGDVDTGPNDLLNFPVITSASVSNGRVDVVVNLDVPAGNYRVEFFTNPSGADPSGYGEGETFVHAVAIVHAGSGVQTFTTRFAGAPGDVVTATVTEDLGAGAYGSTSEFSRAYTTSAGATVLDRSIRRTDLRTAGGTPASGAGAAGSGISFAGADERLVGPATDLTSGAITLSAWVSLDAASTAPRVISKRAAGGAIYELLIDDATGEAAAKFDIGGAQVSVQGGALTIGDWHQVAATWDGTTVRLYVDGAEVAQTAASGTLGTDLAAPLIVGNAADASGGLVGSVDIVELAHTARSAAWIETAYLNVSDPARFVSVGEVQLAAPGTWAASSAVVRSGSGSLAAPASTADADAWTTVTGLDEPGLAFESWWYVTAPATSNIAAGTNTGLSPVEQRELGSTGGTVDLATRLVGARTVDVASAAPVPASTWTRVEIRTDELGRSSAWIDGVQVIGPTLHSGGTSAGSAGLRAGTLDAGGWYVDDVRIRRYVSDEPTTTLGPLHRN